ncbi:hypothetical protein J7E91_02045 [Streptomyces sp. ISL-99]|uniref:hypothetical protein n=1 Tax=Streptomyces sp. ISL-99 TaxID=2819193 RepID=UPI001BEBE4FC|nr:hypothetical protein [Streptomyces sp. ISL-99]MBT2524245.1 hypothetical protein [Streptomyces sp. ISL-99]
MSAMCHVPRAARGGAVRGRAVTVLLMLVLVLTAVVAAVLGEGGFGQARLPVSLAAETLPSGTGSGSSSGSGAEGQPSDAADSEVRGAGHSARGARRGRVRNGGRGRAAGAVASYRRTGTRRRHLCPARPPGVPVDAPPSRLAVRRCVVLRC